MLSLNLKQSDPAVHKAIAQELSRQNESIELIASENFVSQAVLDAQGSVLTNKYAEGYPGKRWYNGCENADTVEALAIDRAKQIFGAEHANVQPHSGSAANMAVYFAMLSLGDTVLAMNLAHGGHLTHGHPMNFSGKFFKIVPYGVDEKTETIDYDVLESLAVECKPRMILGGASAYPRIIDSDRLRKIADKVGALLMVDMAHFAGLVAAGLHPNPVTSCDFVTTTTHKTLRGPRGGMILCRKQYADAIDKMVFPGIQGGPLMHVIAAKAVAFGEALTPEFKVYQTQIVKNAKALAAELMRLGLRIVSGGTDNHLMLVDTTSKKISGKEASNALHEAGITCNKNMIPFDKASPFATSGVRLGTPAVTTRGMKESEMKVIASLIAQVMDHPTDQVCKDKAKQVVAGLCKAFPLYA